MTRYGFVASGGGYRSFYTAGALVWMHKERIPVIHVTSTSSGNNIVLDTMIWDAEAEDLPPTLGRTFRLGVSDIFHVFKNFLGLQPSLLPAGSHLFTVDKDRCCKALQLDNPDRRAVLARNLEATRWDILATNLRERQTHSFSVNEMLATVDDTGLEAFMDAFLAGITTIPYFKAQEIGDDLYVEGGYMDNTPMRTLFADPDVDEIIACDFTDYDYQGELEKIYKTSMFTLPLNSIDMHLLVSDLQLSLPNIKIFDQAILINRLLEAMKKKKVTIDGKTYHRKPLHILRPAQLESMTISLKDSTAQKRYFEQGQVETEGLFKGM